LVEKTALHLGDSIGEPSEAPHFLSKLTPFERGSLFTEGLQKQIKAGQLLFRQNDRHSGIYILQEGSVRTFYIAPAGREITLAYWQAGQFVGGPEIFGKGTHLWSGAAVGDTRVLYLSGTQLERLCREMPNLALALIDGLVYKGRCFSDVIQMLGTRNASQRLAQAILAMRNPTAGGNAEIRLVRGITHDELASMIGATRQWVSTSMKRLERRGLIRMDGRQIVITSQAALQEEARS
jgi:CRP/FNR family transcriptional regulator, cyclic AMP receptor protein